MRLVTRIETNTTTDNKPAANDPRTHRSSSTSCRCGQQLDLCARAHCPRCGRSLRRF
jgi:uncharacterized paraquat-inducible protein A